MRIVSLQELAQFLGPETVIGEKDYRVEGLTAVTSAKDNEICIISDEKDLQNLRAYSRDIKAAVVAQEFGENLPEGINYIIVEDANAAGTLLMTLFSKSRTVVPAP